MLHELKCHTSIEGMPYKNNQYDAFIFYFEFGEVTHKKFTHFLVSLDHLGEQFAR